VQTFVVFNDRSRLCNSVGRCLAQVLVVRDIARSWLPVSIT